MKRWLLALVSVGLAACPVYGSIGEWERVGAGTTTGSTGSGMSACMPGVIAPCYDGPPGTEGVGSCKPGTKTCGGDGKSWGPCTGEVLPQMTEACGTDQNCDGLVQPCKGRLLWAKRFGDVKPFDELDQTIAVDNAGSVFIAGNFNGTVDFGGGPLISQGSGSMFVVKLDTNGQHVWSKSFVGTGENYARGIAVDSMGHVLVTGFFGGSITFGGTALTSAVGAGIFVVKLDINGEHLWSKGFGDTDQHEGTGITSDGMGAVLVTGFFLGTVDFGGTVLQSAGGREVFVVKLDADGNHVWSKQSGGDVGAQQGTDPSVSIATDAANDVVVGGSFVTPLDFGGGPLKNGGGFDAFVAKLDASGQHLWSKSFGGPGDQSVTNVAVDPLDRVLVTGGFEDSVDFGGGALVSAGLTDVFVAQLTPGGQHVWSKRFGDASYQSARGIAVDGTGNTLLTGAFAGSINFGDNPLASAGGTDAFVAKLDGDGGAVWSRRFGNAAEQRGARVSADGAGNVLVTGFCAGGPFDFGGGPVSGSAGTDVFVVKLSP